MKNSENKLLNFSLRDELFHLKAGCFTQKRLEVI